MAMTTDEFSIYIEGLEKLAQDQAQKVVNEAAAKCDAAAKQVCPVDTGNLRSSIHIETGDLEATVGTNVEYAPYVEYGTYKMKAQPFMSVGAEAAIEALPQILKNAKIV
jgi:HK97 gp10 family phage protein